MIDGGIVVKALLVLGLWLAGWGAARLVAAALPAAGAGGQFVAITLAIWNPYVAERLLQGHWSLLVGYGCLPWVAAAMLTLRVDGAGGIGWSGVFGLAFWIALAGLTPTGLLLAATVALVCVAPGAGPGAGRPRWLCAAVALGAALVAALPWLTASALGSSLTAIRRRTPSGSTRSRRAPSPVWARWAAWPASAGSGTARPYRPRGQRFSRCRRPLVLLGVVAAGLPAVVRRPAAVPLLVLAAVAVLVPACAGDRPGPARAARGG